MVGVEEILEVIVYWDDQIGEEGLEKRAGLFDDFEYVFAVLFYD